MTAVVSMASSGSYDPGRLGTTYLRRSVHTPLATTASFAGAEQVFGDGIMNALTSAHDAAVEMIDTSIVRVHQRGACVARLA